MDHQSLADSFLQVAPQPGPANIMNLKITEDKDTKLCDFCQELVAAKATRCRHCHASLSKKSTEDNQTFSVVREELPEVIGSMTQKITKISVVIKDETLKAHLKNYMPHNAKFFDKEPVISADELFPFLPNFRQTELSYIGSGILNPIKPLLDFLEKEYEDQSERFELMKKEGVITFEALQFLFTRGTKVFGFEGPYKVGAEVTDTTYTKTLFTTLFVISGEVIKANGERFFCFNHNLVIPSFKVFLLLVSNASPSPYIIDMGYKGNMRYKTPFYTTSWKADGRIMLDGNSFNKMNPDYKEFIPNPHVGGVRMFTGNAQVNDQDIKDLPEETWFKTWPTIGGFSFSVKKWGEIAVENCYDIKKYATVSTFIVNLLKIDLWSIFNKFTMNVLTVADVQDIQFDDLSYARLVLDAEKKELIRALVLHTENAFADIISGKGAGCIFLLHGKPGCGKTLTAEAIAEMLHRPLYSVSVGELGTKTSTLEQKLRDILEVASVWNAVILIDEADIFLEKRTDADVERNAMVGIFLRLLEYHQGILFLTTNRVKRFDEAFHSRISVALKYEDLGELARKKVWTNFFEVAGIKGLDIDVLSKHPLNGRQIRNTIRLAQALSKSEQVPLSMKHLECTIKVASQFTKDLNEETKGNFTSPTKWGIIGGVVLVATAVCMKFRK